MLAPNYFASSCTAKAKPRYFPSAIPEEGRRNRNRLESLSSGAAGGEDDCAAGEDTDRPGDDSELVFKDLDDQPPEHAPDECCGERGRNRG